MRWGAFAAALLAVCVIQTTVLALAGAALRALDLFLALAILCGLCAGSREAPVAAWVVGLVQDLVSIDPLGSHAVGLAVGVFVVVFLRDWAFADALLVQAVIAALGAISAAIIVDVLRVLSFSLWKSADHGAAFAIPWLSCIVSSLLAVLIVRSASWFSKRRFLRPPRSDW